MTAPVNTVVSANNVGAREDLSNMIYLVAPTETPFLSTVSRGKAKAVKHDWQTEGLATPNPENAQLEGDDVTNFDAPNLTVRVENICQIFRKTGSVARTQDVVDLAGRAKETARQKVLKMREMKRDMETAAIGNRPSQVENGANPRKLAGMLAFIASNSSSGTGGSAGGYVPGGIVSAATNGAQRTLSESLFKAGMAQVFAAGGKPTVAMMGGTLKQEFSSFTGIAEIRVDAPKPKMATIIGAADIYVSDFGTISLVPHPYALQRDLACIDPDMWKWAELDGTKSTPLAKTGDAEKFMITCEPTLEASNEKANFALRDLM